MRKLMVTSIITILIVSSITWANDLINKQSYWEALKSTNQSIFGYIEEDIMGHATTLTYTQYSTLCMERKSARNSLGI